MTPPNHRAPTATPDAGPSLTRLVLDLPSVKELAARMPAPKSARVASANAVGQDDKAPGPVLLPSVSPTTPSPGHAPTH